MGSTKQLVQIGLAPAKPQEGRLPRKRVFWVQGITLAWMLIEFGVSAYAAVKARSPVLMAFSSDSIVELISAAVVLLQWVPGVSISEHRAARTASVLLFVLAGVVVAVASTALIGGLNPQPSRAGMAITVAALIAMPVLAWLKRHEARQLGNAALAADAAQSATCAYLALITLAGLSIHAIFHVAWFDSAAALVAVPILVKEGRSSWNGQSCKCCG